MIKLIHIFVLVLLGPWLAIVPAAEPPAEPGATEPDRSSEAVPTAMPLPERERSSARPMREGSRDWNRGPGRDGARDGSPLEARGALHRHRRMPTAAELDRIIEIAREIDPERGEQWTKQRSEDAAGFQRAIMMRGKLMFGLLELEKRYPQLFEVRLCELRAQARSKRLASEWRAVTQRGSLGDAAAIEADMRASVKEQLECGQQARAHEIVILHEHQKKLRENLQHSLANSERLIEARLQELMKDAQGDDRPAARPAPEPDDPRWNGDFEPDNG